MPVMAAATTPDSPLKKNKINTIEKMVQTKIEFRAIERNPLSNPPMQPPPIRLANI